jgi:type 1 glutamine amidotransferase
MIKSPVASQVFQREANGRAAIAIELDESVKNARVVDAALMAGGMDGSAFANNQQGDRTRFVDGKLVGVPVGGPYTIAVTIKKGQGQTTVIESVGPVFVGDLWVLAGQSNMQGVGNLLDVTPPNNLVMLLGMDGKWSKAEEPLHWLVDSPAPVHSGDPATRAERSAKEHKTRTKGSGLGLPFAVAMVEQTRVPVGLVACAHGGTSMEQWSPTKKEERGKSLYGSMLRQVRLAGGKVKGVLWYQGEADASANASKIYSRVFADFIASVRSDFGQPELPFYYVQIGRFTHAGDPSGWNAVQEAQRRLPERVPNTAVVSVIDLELDDAIHVGTHGLKRAGQRLARIAQRELFGQLGAATPTLDRVSRGPHNTLIVKFKGVNMGYPQNAGMGRPVAFGMGGMASANGAAMVGPSQGRGMPGGMGGMGGGMGGISVGAGGMGVSPGETSGLGLKPERHIAGFSIRKEDGTLLPLVFEACLGTAHDTVILKLAGRIPEKAFLWYGYGYDPYCNLVDSLDMAVPVFGPIALDEISETMAPALAAFTAAANATSASATASSANSRPAAESHQTPVKLLITTGDHGHDWKATTAALKDILSAGGKISVDVTTSPSTDLTDANLAKYDALLLNYKDTPKGSPESRWSDANKQAFLKAVRDGKGLIVFHHASSAFVKPNWDEFEKAIAGGWRSQGFHGPKHIYNVKKTAAKHPISEGLPDQFEHKKDELYQNSVMVPGNEVLATAYSDPGKPRGTGKDEPIIWVNTYGKGRVYNNAMGHDTEAMSDPNFQAWLRRGVLWAATGKAD